MIRFLLFAVLLALWPPARMAQAEQGCQAPEWDGRLLPLVQQLGDFMGAPVECPQPDPNSGDTLQATSTGLAYVQAGSNIPIFTNGQDHVALTSQGLTGWDGGSTDAPLLLALPDAALPTFCTQQAVSAQLSNEYLCSYPDNSVAIWALPTGAQTWQVLGTEAEPGGSWSLTDAGAGLSAGVPPATLAQQPRPTQPAPAAQQAPVPVLLPPSDSDLAVSLNPVTPASSVLVTGSACNRSTGYAADNVEIDFAFTAAGGLSPTPDHAAYDISQIAPNSCSQIVTSINTVFPWQSIEVGDTRVDWQRAG